MSCCDNHPVKKESFFNSTKWSIIVLSVSLVTLILSYLWHNIAGDGLLMYFNPAYIAIILCGWPLFKSAAVNLFTKHKITSALLISTAMIATITLEIIGYFNIGQHTGDSHYLFAGGEIAFLMRIGELIENYTVRKSRSGISKLISLKPTMARVKIDNNYIELEADFVEIGDTVLVKPNEKISVDGIVLSGNSAVDMSAINGESTPNDVSAGSLVYAGTFNKSGAIYIEVTRKNSETTVSKMIELVEQADNKKAPIARLADRWSSYIVPSAICISVLVYIFTFFVFKVEWMEALTRAVTILVTFCPCALALATPTAVAAGIGVASYKGVLIKSGQALESLANVNCVAFDKTGTLSEGQIVVNDYKCNIDIAKFMYYTGTAEQNSEHPTAKAVVKFASNQVSLGTASSTTSLMGVGVEATVDNVKVLIAKIQHFDKIDEKSLQYANDEINKGYSVIGVSIDGVFVGTLSLSDKIRPASKETVGLINQMGINTVMLTGDNSLVANEVGNNLGISAVKSQLMPQDKVTAVEQLKAEGYKVCMVGDGVNDAPSLATAQCSIAMGAIGNDVALEVADIALMNSDISKLSGLIKLSRKVLRKIKRNIVISMCINVIAVVIASLGILDPAGGALLHNASSLFVVINSALLLTNKDIKK